MVLEIKQVKKDQAKKKPEIIKEISEVIHKLRSKIF